jgi:peptide/nickel transport system substrate-binding protein
LIPELAADSSSAVGTEKNIERVDPHMRFKKPIVALSAACLLTLAACGGSGGGNGNGPGVDTSNLGNTGNGQDATRQGPVTIEGATEGGTVTVLTSIGFTTPIDPTDLYYVDTNSIMTSLVTRQLTQYAYDKATGQMILVPDLATDLGTHNDDYTEWTFTLKDGIKWENGDPITAKEVAFGIIRSYDQETFVNGPGIYYTNPYFLEGDTYKGPYTGNDPDGTKQHAVTYDDAAKTVTVKMAKPFSDFPYYASMPAMGPIPTDPAISDPATYGQHPWASGPYKIDSYVIGKSLVLSRNENWDPATDPARTQYPDGYVFKGGQDPLKIDQILLADSGAGQTTLTYDDVQSQDYRKFQNDHADRLVIGGSPCTYFYALDTRTVKDPAITEALTWALPYKDQILASGLIPDVNAIAATNIMPPGVPGRTEYTAVEGHGPFETDTAKAKQILTDAGLLNYEIKFLFRTDLDTDVQSKAVLTKSLTEAGFKATAIPTTVADYVATRDNPKTPINVRSYGWCSDWPSGATWIPPLFQSTDIAKIGFGTNESAFNVPAIDQKIDDTFKLPAADQPAAWDAIGKEILTKYLPVVPRYYTGVAMAHGSKINGMYDDNTLGAPTFRNIWVSQ